jgi:hypothetical protein
MLKREGGEGWGGEGRERVHLQANDAYVFGRYTGL